MKPERAKLRADRATPASPARRGGARALPAPITPPNRPGRLHWAMLAFLLGFAALIVIAGYFFLAPGAQAMRDAGAGPQERQRIKAYAALLLMVLLVLLFVLMLLLFRVRRFFFDERPRTRTEYPDAWAESARRVHIDDDQE